MYIKIEPTGTCQRKGMVQVRLCFYLDANDYGYEKHHVPDITEEYTGKPEDYQTWLDSLPKRDNPFHNHFIQVPPDASDKEIVALAKDYLKLTYDKWVKGEQIKLSNMVQWPSKVDAARIATCEAKAEQFKTLEIK